MLRFVLAEDYGLVKVGVAENPQNAVDANFPLGACCSQLEGLFGPYFQQEL